MLLSGLSFITSHSSSFTVRDLSCCCIFLTYESSRTVCFKPHVAVTRLCNSDTHVYHRHALVSSLTSRHVNTSSVYQQLVSHTRLVSQAIRSQVNWGFPAPFSLPLSSRTSHFPSTLTAPTACNAQSVAEHRPLLFKPRQERRASLGAYGKYYTSAWDGTITAALSVFILQDGAACVCDYGHCSYAVDLNSVSVFGGCLCSALHA